MAEKDERQGISWDGYFMGIAQAVSKKSHCLSHKFGAVAVRDNYIISTGYNGPPAGYPHCGDKTSLFGQQCPRHKVGYKSGEGLEVCPAAHAELNVLIEAAKIGHRLDGCTIYSASPCPCRECSKAIVNAGIREVVILSGTNYPDIGLTGKEILERCGVTIRYIDILRCDICHEGFDVTGKNHIICPGCGTQYNKMRHWPIY